MDDTNKKHWLLLAGLLLANLLFTGCAGQLHTPPATTANRTPAHPSSATSLPMLGYTIQVGAFSHLDNAVRLMES
ncbi:MAG: hypothetical protein OEL66_06010, partial [Desulfobulbaceae bacterium]|nr:hypothetical protein [Desulfobulbaceae bacterium]